MVTSDKIYYEKSTIKIRFHRIGSVIIVFLKKIFKLLINLVLLFLKRIQNGADSIYAYLYPKVVGARKRLVRIVSALNLLAIITLAVLYFFTEYYNNDYLILLLKVDGVIIATYLFLKIYHFLFGQFAVIAAEEQYTRLFIKKLYPNYGTYCGVTGGGKDEADKGVIMVKREGMIEDINKRMKFIKKAAYIFDCDLIGETVEAYSDMFASSSEVFTKNNFILLAKENNFFLKKYYINKIDQDELLNDAVLFKKEKVTHGSNLIFNSGGINKEHFLDMAYEYAMLYMRIFIEKNIIVANQPFVEDFETGLMAKQFSLNYTFTNAISDISMSLPDEWGRKVLTPLEERIQFPLKDYLIIDQTEAGTFYNNLDGNITAEIKKHGIRSFYAYNRHMFPHMCLYMIDQDGDRTNKQLEELNHAYMRVVNRVEVDGGLKRNIVLNAVSWIIEKLMYISYRNLGKENNRRIKKRTKIDYYYELFLASNNYVYKKKAQMLEELELKKPTAFYEKLAALQKKILERIEKNKYVDGYIVKEIVISHNISYNMDLEAFSAKKFLNNESLIRSTYAVRLVQKKSDCWRYDTHYMKCIKENRARKSEVNFTDIPNWSSSLLMGGKEALQLGYSSAFDMFAIPEEMQILSRYKIKNIQKNTTF